MTAENVKKLYDFFMEQGRVAEAEELAKGRPEILETKSKGKK